jgi:hypothetical protein
MTKPTKKSESETVASKPKPSVCAACTSPDMTCCKVTLDARWKIYYMQCQKCHEIEVFKIDKGKNE